MEPRRIMMVDDESSFTHLAKLNLEKTGKYALCVENDPTKAVDAARAFQPELILLDIVMPGKDGGEIMAELQRDPELGRVPVAFLTATLSIAAVAERDNQIKGCPCIAKPISPKELMREIETILKNHR
jgi:CheY-like chemotaxis protein